MSCRGLQTLYILGPVCPARVRESKTIPLRFFAEPEDNINDNAHSFSCEVSLIPNQINPDALCLKDYLFPHVAHCREIKGIANFYEQLRWNLKSN